MVNMEVTNELSVLLLLATSVAIAFAENEENPGADDIARQSDLFALKADMKSIQGEVDSISKNQQNLQGEVVSIVKMLEALRAGIAPLLSLRDFSLSLEMEPKKIMETEREAVHSIFQYI